MTQGRNFGLGYIALTQRLASVDSNLVEISGLKYFGKTERDNNRRKAKAWLSTEYLDRARERGLESFFSDVEDISTIISVFRFFASTVCKKDALK